MLFQSIEFLIFLPIVFLLYWFVFNKSLQRQNAFIVLASFFFYGIWEWRFLILLAITSFCSWGSGLLIQKYKDTQKKAKAISAANVVMNLSILCIFKYYDFFATSFADLFLNGKTDGILLNLILPVGISFYTFQALSYSIDVYRGKIEPTQDIIEFFAFVSFFPQLVAGPIERATNLLPQFQKKRTFEYAQAADGMRQILWGMFKKVVIADNCAHFVDKIFNTYQTQSGSTLLLAAILFAFQIYGDFSGYSDIAIGTAKLFGITLKRNFNVPYFSRDIAEFWRRWHISLTSWFRDYLYIPLGGSRCSKAKTIRNTLIIFLFCGLWHGANWTFIIWGAYNAALFLLLILYGKKEHTDIIAADRNLPTGIELFQMFVTFFLVVMGMIIFRSDTIGQAWDIISALFHLETLKASYLFFVHPDIYKKSLVIVIMLAIEWVYRRDDYNFSLKNIKKPICRYCIYYVLITAILLCYGEEQTFIYFQF